MQLRLPSGVLLDTAWASSAAQATLDSELDLVIQYFKQIAAIRNRRSPLLKLPAELLHLVVGHVHTPDDLKDMMSCMLVCTSLAPIAQARLYSAAKIITPRQAMLLGALSITRPDLLDATRELRLSETYIFPNSDRKTLHHPTWDGEVKMFPPLHHVRRLTFIASPCNDEYSLFLTDARDQVLDMFSRIVDLTLMEDKNFAYLEDGQRDVCALVGLFPALRTLTITRIIDVTIEKYVIEDSYEEDRIHFSWSTLSRQCPNLRYIDLCINGRTSLDAISAFIVKLQGAAVESIILRNADVWDELPFSAFVDICSQLHAARIPSFRINSWRYVRLFLDDHPLQNIIRDAGCTGTRTTTMDDRVLDDFDMTGAVGSSLPPHSCTLRLVYNAWDLEFISEVAILLSL